MLVDWATHPVPRGGGRVGINGQAATSALGSGRACSPRRSSPTVHFVCILGIQCPGEGQLELVPL